MLAVELVGFEGVMAKVRDRLMRNRKVGSMEYIEDVFTVVYDLFVEEDRGYLGRMMKHFHFNIPFPASLAHNSGEDH